MEVMDSVVGEADHLDHQSEHDEQDRHSEHSDHDQNAADPEGSRLSLLNDVKSWPGFVLVTRGLS